MPASKIAGLSSGEFAGMVADYPSQKTKLRTFNCEIINDYDPLKAEQKNYRFLPELKDVYNTIDK